MPPGAKLRPAADPRRDGGDAGQGCREHGEDRLGAPTQLTPRARRNLDEDAELEVEEEEAGEDGDATSAPDTGPDPAEVGRRMEGLKGLYGKFQKTHAKYGATDKKTIKVREEMAAEFLRLKLPLALMDAFVRKLREAAGSRFAAGVVLYDGTAVTPFGDDLFAVPLRSLWEDS